MVYAFCFQIGFAGGVSGNDNDCCSANLFIDLWNCCGVFVVGTAGYYYFGFGFQGFGNAFVDGGEAVVVNNLESGAGEEVRCELSACATHCQIAEGEHEYGGLFACVFGFHAQFFKGLCSAIFYYRFDCAFCCLILFRRAAARGFAAFAYSLVERFGEVGILIRSQQYFATCGDVGVAFLSCGFERFLHESFFERGEVSAFFLDLLEEFPCFGGYRGGKVFDVVCSCCGVGYAVEIRFFFQH